MAQRITLSPETYSTFEKMQNKEISYMILKIELGEGKKISLESSGPYSGNQNNLFAFLKVYYLDPHETIISKLPAEEPRFLVLDLVYEKTGVQKSHIIIVRWIPKSIDVKLKLEYAAGSSILRQEFKIKNLIPAETTNDIQLENLKKQVSRFD